ncbi:E2 [Canis familiaris papillomavirus 16]|uniref:Regulatory protein E2 n=1 Tax=Canis familiaris papillomavirus 16 TaxID=1619253 RepID=A0A0C5LBQ0_9PAPI|nr:E2 [Canis familiaris papillomavirus 16]AJP70544.1 E2 [Canis familiaris papillomavirus 16]
MENLRKRLDAIQNALLTLYEEGSDSLDDQVQHWNLCRKENVLLHFARKSGLIRLGIQPVPTLTVSSERAKCAIEMQLILQTLQDSPYATERWTLGDTSRERWTAEPQNCLKKGAVIVEVYFDGDPTNAMRYTMWTYVYYVDSNDKWQKTRSNVDREGIWFWDNGHRRYYVRFHEEAKRYSKTGDWQVMFNNDLISSSDPVTSTTSTTTNLGTQAKRPADGESERVAGGGGATAHKKARTEGSDHAPGEPPPAEEETPQQEEPDTVAGLQLGGPVRGESDSSTRKSPADSTRQVVTPVPADTPEPLPGCVSTTPEHPGINPPTDTVPGAGSGPSQASPAPDSPSAARPPAIPLGAEEGPEAGLGPGQQGRLPPANRTTRGSRLLLRQAGNSTPSVIALAGPCNTLKCLRYRVKQYHRDLIGGISTTWYWAGDGAERIGSARILIFFRDNGQRSAFLDRVRLPPSVTLLDSVHSM